MYLNAFGKGYVISENPKKLINYDIAKIRPLTKDRYVKRLLLLIQQYTPSLILLRGYSDTNNKINKRLIKVISVFEKETEKLNLLFMNPFERILSKCLINLKEAQNIMISKTITSWHPELKQFMPDI